MLTCHEGATRSVAIDVTISCFLLPRYVAASSRSADEPFASRAAEKNDSHMRGCREVGRTFLPIVFSTLGGIGPPAAIKWLDSLFSAAYARERSAGGTGHETNRRRAMFYQLLQCTITSATANMTVSLPRHAASPPSSESHAIDTTAPSDASAPSSATTCTTSPLTLIADSQP